MRLMTLRLKVKFQNLIQTDIDNSDYNDPDFLSHIGSGSFYDFAHAGTYFKLEKRPEEQNMPRTMDAKLSKAFYRVTSIGTGNGEGLVKLQGQIATVVQKAPETEVNDPCESGDC